MSIPGDYPAFLFEDRQTPGDWHVQWTDDDGGFEMAMFSGPRARERAIIFAERSTAVTKKSVPAEMCRS